MFSRRKFLVGSLAATGCFAAPAYALQVPRQDDAVVQRLQTVPLLLEADRQADDMATVWDEAYATDATVAWDYFKQWKSYHGMVPGTAYRKDGKLGGYGLATMWDVASCLNANCSAYVTGLIDFHQLSDRVHRIVSLLERNSLRFEGSRLPKVQVATASMTPDLEGFDSADSGRLLIALKIADNFTFGESGISDLVKSWNFSPVIRKGRLHNIENGHLRSFAANSYTHYTTRGYRLWGYELDAVVEPASMHSLDSQAELFRDVAARGRLATEPNTTEQIELGPDASTDFLCDILYAAQIKRYADTGILTCVSEGIIDQTPWFTYQACQLREDGDDQWVIDTSSRANSKIVEAKGGKLRTISTKGCFLWHATRPGTYSRKLLSLARTTARLDGLGYASNIYENTLRPTYCSDVNCSAMILECLAFIKGGRIPLLAQSERHRLLGALL